VTSNNQSVDLVVKGKNDNPIHNEEFENYKKLIFEKIDQQTVEKEGMLQVSYLDAISMIICKFCSKDYRKMAIMVGKAQKEMSKYLNYLDIIQMLQEFRKLKLILMNSEQFMIFSNTSKPFISVKDEVDTVINKSIEQCWCF